METIQGPRTRRSDRPGRKRLALILAVLALTAVLLGALGQASNGRSTLSSPITRQAFALDTIISISAYETAEDDRSGERTTAILDQALSDCTAYEDIFSMQKEGSALWDLNHGVTNKVPWQLADCLESSLYYANLSGGAFQVSIGKVSQLWDFTADDPKVPSKEEIAQALAYVDDSKVSVAPKDEGDPTADREVSMPEGWVLDLGSIAKGYIADQLKEELENAGIRRALINLGGNVLAFGGKSGGQVNADDTLNGTPFTIGIRRPFGEANDYIATVRTANLSIVSSGTYERQFTDSDGQFYYHILDPKTGYPYETTLSQVTILTPSSTSADALSTVCFALGQERGLALIESLPDTEAVFVANDGQIAMSSGAAALVTLNDSQS